MTDNMIERVARALCLAHYGQDVRWDLFARHAFIAIEAMREPTSDIIEVGESTLIDAAFGESM